MRIINPVLQVLLIIFFGLHWQVNFLPPGQLELSKETPANEVELPLVVCDLKPPPPPPEILCIKPEMPYLASCEQLMDKMERKQCSDQQILGFIYSNFRPPLDQAGCSSVAVVSFTVDKHGRVQDPIVRRSVNPAFDAEALRVVRALPLFKPGKINGKVVPMPFHIPFRFRTE